MDVTLSCGLCGFEIGAENTDGPGAEHITNLYTNTHPGHTPEQIRDFVHANGRNLEYGNGGDSDE